MIRACATSKASLGALGFGACAVCVGIQNHECLYHDQSCWAGRCCMAVSVCVKGGVTGTSVAGGIGSQAPAAVQPLWPSGTPASTRRLSQCHMHFSWCCQLCVGPRAQPPSLVIQNRRHGFQCSPWLFCPSMPRPPTFNNTDGKLLMSWCVGWRHLCWVADVFLVVDWKGEHKESISTAMMLMSHHKDYSCSGGRQWCFRYLEGDTWEHI